jgi:hypothetical protein
MVDTATALLKIADRFDALADKREQKQSRAAPASSQC